MSTINESSNPPAHTPRLLLASASPRRLALLAQIKVDVKQLLVPSPAGEDEPRHPNETVIDYVIRTTDDKRDRALDLLGKNHGFAVITADTTVAIGQDILGKPMDQENAIQMLRLLSDRTHDVYTAVDLFCEGVTYRALSHSLVTFAPLAEEDITHYVQTNEPFGKAGAYAIQGIAAQYVKRIEGSFSGVMGLPLYETAQLLRQASIT